MNLSKSQNILTIVFISLMLINILAGVSLFQDEVSEILSIFLGIYGVHFSIIITFYFVEKRSNAQKIIVEKFKIFLLLFLVLAWNVIMLFVTYSCPDTTENLQDKLMEATKFADFLIAAGIIWLYNGNNKIELLSSDILEE